MAGFLTSATLQNAQLHVHVLSEAAAILQLRRPRTSALLAAASDLARSVDELEARAERLRTDEEAARDHARELQREWQDLQATRRQLDAAAEERERRGESCQGLGSSARCIYALEEQRTRS